MIEGWAQQHIDSLQSYTEITPSGTGLHTIVEGTLPPKHRRKELIEMYNYARFFTMTGWHLNETPLTIEPRAVPLGVLWCSLFAPTVNQHVWLLDTQDTIHNADGKPWRIVSIATAPSGAWYATFTQMPGGWPLLQCELAVGVHGQPAPAVFDDTVIIEKALAAKNGRKVQQLAAGQWQQYDYPSQSEADLGFCQEVAFWTQDPAQIDRLFRGTDLMRPKWDEARGKLPYGQKTIQEALARQTEHYWTGSFVVDPPQGASTNGTHASVSSPVQGVPNWKIATPARHFDVTASLSSEEILKLMLVPPRFLVDKLIPDGLTILGAPAKSYKSFFSLSLALATIGIGDWCDAFPIEEENQGDVVFFGLEAPWEQLRRRMHQLRPNYAAGQTAHKIHFFSGMKCLPSAQDGLHEAIVETIHHFHPRLIVIDPLSYLYRMGRRDDLVTATLDLLWPLAEVAVKNQVAIFAPEHMRKRSKDDVSVLDTLGGSHIKPAVAQAVIMLIRQDEEILLDTTMRDARSQKFSMTLDFDDQSFVQWGYKGSTTLLSNDPTYSNLRLKLLDVLQACATQLDIEDMLIAVDLPVTRENKQLLASILNRAIKAREVARVSRGHYVWIGGK
jgi:hypothetical protein